MEAGDDVKVLQRTKAHGKWEKEMLRFLSTRSNHGPYPHSEPTVAGRKTSMAVLNEL